MTRVWGTVYVLASLGCASNAPSALPTSETWVQVWSDEFDGAAGASIDTTKWRYDTADGCAGGNCGWGNNEKEYYSTAPENISLNGRGQLLIVARPVPAGAGLRCYYGPCRYTSAKITTRGKMEVAPGRVTARIKLAPGQRARHHQLGDPRPRVLGEHAVRACPPTPGWHVYRFLPYVRCRMGLAHHTVLRRRYGPLRRQAWRRRALRQLGLRPAVLRDLESGRRGEFRRRSGIGCDLPGDDARRLRAGLSARAGARTLGPMERRAFVHTLGAAAAGGLVAPGRWGLAGGGRGGSAKRLERIGLELYSVRHAMARDP